MAAKSAKERAKDTVSKWKLSKSPKEKHREEKSPKEKTRKEKSPKKLHKEKSDGVKSVERVKAEK